MTERYNGPAHLRHLCRGFRRPGLIGRGGLAHQGDQPIDSRPEDKETDDEGGEPAEPAEGKAETGMSGNPAEPQASRVCPVKERPPRTVSGATTAMKGEKVFMKLRKKGSLAGMVLFSAGWMWRRKAAKPPAHKTAETI